jgi:SAM-dependent methyltransferase
MNKIKLNIGASPIWEKEGWHTLDHKYKGKDNYKISGDISKIRLPDKSCSVVFCSHIFEHIPHIKLPLAIAEINRVLEKNGVLRILTPDLEKICKAYAKKDKNFFKKALEEDENIRTDLGLGGMLMNFIVSPGQDTALLNRNLDKFIAGYAHLYSYDYKMMSIILKKNGFIPRKASFNDSKIKEMIIPMHVKNLKPIWQNLNKKFYKKEKLMHKLIKGKYKINFKTTGFDRDPFTSLIIEAVKHKNVNKNKIDQFFNNSNKNYNKYAYSLNTDKQFLRARREKKIY